MYKDIIVQINISSGTAGELKYPSYNHEHGWSYPKRGELQCYSESAKMSFKKWLIIKYGTLDNINKSWGTNIPDIDKIEMPDDKDIFFINGYRSSYGKDLLEWYQRCLEGHLEKNAALAHQHFDKVFNAGIAQSIAGVHWLRHHPFMPGSAEYCAGYYNYDWLAASFKSANLIMILNCIEMSETDKFSSPEYSAPRELLRDVIKPAADRGIVVYGANALPLNSDPQKYENIKTAIAEYNIQGMIYSGISYLSDSAGNLSKDMDMLNRLSTFQETTTSRSD